MIVEEMSSRQAVFEKGHTMLNELQNACLLEGSGSFVKMNDLVGSMALSIRSANPRFLVYAGVGLRHTKARRLDRGCCKSVFDEQQYIRHSS